MNVPIIAFSGPVRWKAGSIPATGPSFPTCAGQQDADCFCSCTFLLDADTAECIVAKNRHGETSTVPLVWDGAHTRFMDVDFKR